MRFVDYDLYARLTDHNIIQIRNGIDEAWPEMNGWTVEEARGLAVFLGALADKAEMRETEVTELAKALGEAESAGRFTHKATARKLIEMGYHK